MIFISYIHAYVNLFILPLCALATAGLAIILGGVAGDIYSLPEKLGILDNKCHNIMR